MATAVTAPVDERLGIIASKLAGADFSAKVPGLKDLLDDYLDPLVEVNKNSFHRRLLEVFKYSEADFTYEKLRDRHTEDEKQRLEDFVTGKKTLEEASKGFVMGPSLGVREEIGRLEEGQQIRVSSSGPIHVDGLSDGELEQKDDLLHKFGHKLAELFHHHEDEDEVTVITGQTEIEASC